MALCIVAGLLIPAANVSANAVSATKSTTPTIVETSWLEQNLNNAKVRIIEVSRDPGLYEKWHSAGATKFV